MKREIIDENQISLLCGNQFFDSVVRPSLWRIGSWSVSFSFMGTGFVGVSMNYQDFILYVVNVYAPCSLIEKRRGWEELKGLKHDYLLGVVYCWRF